MINQTTFKRIAEILNQEYPKHFNSKLAFAGAADVDEKTIRRILKGEQNISLDLLIQICKVLELQPSELLAKAGV